MTEIPYKQYVILPAELGMSTGKAVSQGCHAAHMALKMENPDKILVWEAKGQCVLVCRVKTIAALKDTLMYLRDAGITCHLYIDEGYTEVDAFTPTALATGIIEPDKYWIFDKLELY